MDSLHRFQPDNEQERRDKDHILRYIQDHEHCFSREDDVAHVTVSVWTINPSRTKTLMVYHKVYDSWSWIGGHADGDTDLCAVAMRELQEETGVCNAVLVNNNIFSIECLPVYGHIKKGEYIPSHLHLNVTYLAIADECEVLTINDNENTGVRWFTFEDALTASTEPWMVETVYKKLINKTARIN